MQRVVLIFPGALGDALLALPAWRGLRARHAGVPLRLVVAEPLRALLRLAAVADAIDSLDAATSARLFVDGEPPDWLGRDARVHAWLGADDASLRARLAGWGAVADHHRVERGTGGEHATMAYLRALGVPAPADVAALARIEPAPADVGAVTADLASLPSPVLLVHPGAGGRDKVWPASAVATVARRWRAQGGAVVVLQGPAEPSSWDGDADAIVAGRSLPQVAALLAACDAYLGNDSGISHLAGAVGARGVVVFGPTAPARWRPPSPRLHVVAPARPGPIAAIAATDVLRALDGVIP